MTTAQLLKEQHFERITETKPDNKNRIVITKAVFVKNATSYRVYVNTMGQIFLDPMVSIPASEAWIYNNPEILKAIKDGLQAAKEGKAVKAREDYSNKNNYGISGIYGSSF